MSKTKKLEREAVYAVYIYKNLKFNIRDDIDIFNESVQTQSIEILNKKTKYFNYSYPPPSQAKKINNLYKDFCKDF